MEECNFCELSQEEFCTIKGGIDNHDIGIAETIVGAVGIGSVGVVIGVATTIVAPVAVGVGSAVLIVDGLRRCRD